MSWPLRLLEVFSQNQDVQLFGLRLIMIAFFVVGLVYYRKALLRVTELSPALTHVALLAFVLTPAAGLLAGMYNYDNLAFAMFGFLLYESMNVLYTKGVQARSLVTILIVSLLLCLVKWSSLALVVPLLALLVYHLWTSHRQKFLKRFMASLRSLRRPIQVTLLLGLLIAGILFIERPVQNLLVYGKPNPSCDVVLSKERCMKFVDYANYERTLAAKDANFEPLSLSLYVVRYWVPHMADKAANLIERGSNSRLDIIAALYLVSAVASIVVVIVGWRRIKRSRGLVFFMIITVVYVGILIVKEYGVYTQYGIPGAIRTRYLVPVLPLYFAAVLYVLWPLALRYKQAAVAVGIVGFLLMTQGASIITHLFTAPTSAYSSAVARDSNQALKNALDPIIYND